eukprot:2204405-Rhodomonas_salina.1
MPLVLDVNDLCPVARCAAEEARLARAREGACRVGANCIHVAVVCAYGALLHVRQGTRDPVALVSRVAGARRGPDGVHADSLGVAAGAPVGVVDGRLQDRVVIGAARGAERPALVSGPQSSNVEQEKRVVSSPVKAPVAETAIDCEQYARTSAQ